MWITKQGRSISKSLSARRAWIEIMIQYAYRLSLAVALRKESVDRNARKIRCVAPDVSSLSARRAWIEIVVIGFVLLVNGGRSPQGERG